MKGTTHTGGNFEFEHHNEDLKDTESTREFKIEYLFNNYLKEHDVKYLNSLEKYVLFHKMELIVKSKKDNKQVINFSCDLLRFHCEKFVLFKQTAQHNEIIPDGKYLIKVYIPIFFFFKRTLQKEINLDKNMKIEFIF